MPQELFVACRVLFTKPDKLEYVVFRGSEVARRNDVEVSSKSFATEAEAELEIRYLGGVMRIPIWWRNTLRHMRTYWLCQP
jgi:hypothetical protein